jgi:hypothetical protein
MTGSIAPSQRVRRQEFDLDSIMGRECRAPVRLFLTSASKKKPLLAAIQGTR